MPFLSLSVFNHFRYADDVSIGDEVLVQGEDDELTPAKVIDLSSSTMQGDILWLSLPVAVGISHFVINKWALLSDW